jgi:hypothetical protein
MGPLESFFFGIGFVFIIVGLIRGFLKELGLTTVMIVWLFAMDQLIPRIEELIRGEDTFLVNLGLTGTTMNGTLWLLLSIGTIVVVYIAYQGETLAFEGNPRKGLTGVLFSILIGAVNGYLVSGTLWWILHRYQYPIAEIAQLVPFQQGGQFLSPLAQDIVVNNRLLPPDLLGQGADTATTLGVLPLLVVTLVILRIVR